jgi:hypothetical protein
MRTALWALLPIAAPTAVVAAPPGPPPTLSGIKPPPPAWAETARGPRWLGYSTFCWRTGCADFILPRCGDRRHTPTIYVRHGESVRFHLGFTPSAVTVRYVGKRRVRLATSRQPSWAPPTTGAFWLAARGRDGGASYAACLRFLRSR